MNETGKPNLKSFIWFLGLIWIVMIGISAVAWFYLPDGQKIPVHWGLDGKPDRYGGKLEGLGMMPLITGILIILFWAIPKIEPRKLNFEKSMKAYKVIVGLLMVLMFVIHASTIINALGVSFNLDRVVFLAVGVLFIGIGNVMGKIRSNFFMGIRTPWTLSSELSWRKTHRLGGWLFVSMGLIVIAAGFVQQKLFSIVMLVGIISIVVVLFVYSYLIWKKDPNKQKKGVE